MKIALPLGIPLLFLISCVQGSGSGTFELFGEDGGGGPPGGGDTAPPVSTLILESLDEDGEASGMALPVDPDTGEFQLERGQSFAIVLHAQPSPDTGAALDLVDDEGRGNPDTLTVTADRDLPDPSGDRELIPAGENLAPLFEMIEREDGDGDDEADPAGSVTLAALFGPSDRVPSADPFRLVGLVVDAEDVESVQTEAAVAIIGSLPPSVLMRFEEAPDPGERELTGVPLLRNDANERWVVGTGLRWALVLEAFPNAESGAGFDFVDEDEGGVGDPATLMVTADVDLGDPGGDGVAAGENLAAFFHVEIDPVIDEQSGQQTIALVLDAAGPLAPPEGPVELSAVVVDELGRSSSAAVQVVEVIPNSTLSEDVQPIFTVSCAFAGCHGPPFPAQGLDLSDGQTHGETVGVPSTQSPLNLIEAFDPELSYLVHKVRGTQNDVGGTGDRMPSGRPPLDAERIAAIENWIRLGARDD